MKDNYYLLLSLDFCLRTAKNASSFYFMYVILENWVLSIVFTCLKLRRPSSIGVHGEHSESQGGVYDISNRRRLGLTEWEAVNEMKNGVLEIIKAEAALTWFPKPVEELWKRLSESNATSLLKQHLTPEVYAKLKDKKTSLGGTLAHCISSGEF